MGLLKPLLGLQLAAIHDVLADATGTAALAAPAAAAPVPAASTA